MKPAWSDRDVDIYVGDSRTAWRDLPEQCADAIVTSPPYWKLRDYGVEGQIGDEPTPQEYVETIADLIDGYGRRCMVDTGSVWLNLGDTYATRAQSGNPGARPQLSGNARRRRSGYADRRAAGDWSSDRPREKSLTMIPERVAFALIDRGWIIRNKVVWSKKNAMPTSATDRLANKWEVLYHLTREPRYYYDLEAIKRPFAESSVRRGAPHRANTAGARPGSIYPNGNGQAPDARRYLSGSGANPGDVWHIATVPYVASHWAVFPPDLIRRPILATAPKGGTVLDPFIGSGTTAMVARWYGRRSIGVDLDGGNIPLIVERMDKPDPKLKKKRVKRKPKPPPEQEPTLLSLIEGADGR